MNKLGMISIILYSALLLATSCNKLADDTLDVPDYSCLKLDTITFTHSMKGWELYSFPVNTKWKYSIMIGTNALKTYDQVIANRLSVIGEDSLKVVLSKMPEQEEIFWIGPRWLETRWLSSSGQISLPSRNIQVEIKEFCDRQNLKLIIVD